MSSKPIVKRRIVFIDSRYGNYQIQRQVKGWFRTYWRGTHLCDTLEQAKLIIDYLGKKEVAPYGTILYQT